MLQNPDLRILQSICWKSFQKTDFRFHFCGKLTDIWYRIPVLTSRFCCSIPPITCPLNESGCIVPWSTFKWFPPWPIPSRIAGLANKCVKLYDPCFPLSCDFCRQVWHGLRDAYDIKVEEKIVLRHRRVLDSGAVTILRLSHCKFFFLLQGGVQWCCICFFEM